MRVVVLLLALVAGAFALFAGELLGKELYQTYIASWPEGANWNSAAVAVWYGLPGAAIVAGLIGLLAPGLASMLLFIAGLGWAAMGLLIPAFQIPELALAPGASLLAALLSLVSGELQVRQERATRRRMRERWIEDEDEPEEEEGEADRLEELRRFEEVAREIAAREAALAMEPELLAREDRPISALSALARDEPAAYSPRVDPSEPEFDPFARKAEHDLDVPEQGRASVADVEVEIQLDPEPVRISERPPVPPMREAEPARRAPEPARRGLSVATAMLLAINLIVVAALAGICGYLLANATNLAPTALAAASGTGAASAPVVADAGKTWDDPFAYCAAVGTIDSVDGRYVGAPVPEVVAAALSTPASADSSRVRWRCFSGQVLACRAYAWPVCDPVPTRDEVVSFCALNRDVPRLLAPAGTWSCVGGQPRLPTGVTWARDERNFEPAGWMRVLQPSASMAPRTP